jgi:CheY-like chemotaxis protein
MIILIDDDEPFRTGLAANLREDGCEVLEVASGPSVPVDQLPAIDLVVTDYPMDREDGARIRPTLPSDVPNRTGHHPHGIRHRSPRKRDCRV